MVGRSKASLTFKVAPSKLSRNRSGAFFLLKTPNGEYSQVLEGQVEVHNLRTYHNETVEVQTCYAGDNCSDALPVTALTGVDGEKFILPNRILCIEHFSNQRIAWFVGNPSSSRRSHDGFHSSPGPSQQVCRSCCESDVSVLLLGSSNRCQRAFGWLLCCSEEAQQHVSDLQENSPAHANYARVSRERRIPRVSTLKIYASGDR